MKLAIITAVWKRPEVFELFAKSIKELRKIKYLKVSVIVVGSEGNISESMVTNHGFIYIEKSNESVSDKFNEAAKKAKTLKPDYLMITGSDDLISVDLIKFYMVQLSRKPDFIGVLDFYYYDLVSKKSMYWSGYSGIRSGEPAGALRMISKRLMNKLKWTPFDSGKKRGIDSTLWKKLNDIDHSRLTFKMADYGLFAVDVKSQTNITPFRKWPNCANYPSHLLRKNFIYLPS